MKLAYLILAHHQPALLARLVDRLIDADAHVFIHVDRRADIRPFLHAIRELGSRWAENIHFASDRRTVAYFGFSTVEATLSLMRQAAAQGEFTYYSLLSGVDYPIKPPSVIRNFFAGQDTEFLAYWLLQDRPSWLHKVQYYYLNDLITWRGAERPRLRRFWRVRQSLRYLYWSNFNHYRDRLPKRKYPFPELPPYGGSQWWSLTDGCVRYVLKYVADHPEVPRFYRYTECPDELFFQTIVLNSGFAEKAVNFEKYWRWSRETAPEDKTDETRGSASNYNFRYIDWTGPFGGPRGYPYVLDDRDFEQLRDSPCLFARKFDQEVSATLLDRIDAELIGRPNDAVASPLAAEGS